MGCQVPFLIPCDTLHLDGRHVSMGRQGPRDRQEPKGRQVPSLTPHEHISS